MSDFLLIIGTNSMFFLNTLICWVGIALRQVLAARALLTLQIPAPSLSAPAPSNMKISAAPAGPGLATPPVPMFAAFLQDPALCPR